MLKTTTYQISLCRRQMMKLLPLILLCLLNRYAHGQRPLGNATFGAAHNSSGVINALQPSTTSTTSDPPIEHIQLPGHRTASSNQIATDEEDDETPYPSINDISSENGPRGASPSLIQHARNNKYIPTPTTAHRANGGAPDDAHHDRRVPFNPRRFKSSLAELRKLNNQQKPAEVPERNGSVTTSRGNERGESRQNMLENMHYGNSVSSPGYRRPYESFKTPRDDPLRAIYERINVVSADWFAFNNSVTELRSTKQNHVFIFFYKDLIIVKGADLV